MGAVSERCRPGPRALALVKFNLLLAPLRLMLRSTRNYELDSGAYFLNLLWNLHSLPGERYRRDAVLEDPAVFEAASLMVDTWTVEQRHEELSMYRYSELPREGRGPPSNYTGGAPTWARWGLRQGWGRGRGRCGLGTRGCQRMRLLLSTPLPLPPSALQA